MGLKIASVVVTFNPDDTVSLNITRIANQCESVIVVDNGSQQREFLAELPENCHVIQCHENLGLAAALNLGILTAMAEPYDAIATFDQDTLIPDDYFSNIMSNVVFDDQSIVGVISPIYIDKTTRVIKSFADRRVNFRVKVKDFNLARSTMTSGSIMNPYAIRRCGLFIDEMFIDQLDNELCLRYRRQGYLILESKVVAVEHSVGNNSLKSLFGIRMRPSNHSALRRYYISRNRIFVYKKYFVFDPQWLMMDLRGFVSETVKIILFEDDKREKINMTLRGLADGFRGQMGPYGSRRL